jgi:D-xylose transport system permease protein
LPPADRKGSLLRIAALLALAASTVALLNADRGVPFALLILLGIIAILDGGVRHTRMGRHLLSVGGNAEAALRAGIAVKRVRVIAFTLSGGLAACGGILAASRLLAVNQGSGGGDILLNAIAAAVIGGTSLFGGRGSVWSALTGALVIGSISNGMDLLALSSAVKFMVTGGALLLAVTLDGVARQDQGAARKAV